MSQNDRYAWGAFFAIKKYTDKKLSAELSDYGIIISANANNKILIAKRKTMFRPLGELDWAWYTAKGLGTAYETDNVLQYYEQMLKDDRSPPNKWKRKDEEMELKTKYAERAGRADHVK